MEHQQFPYYIEDWVLWAGNQVDEQGNLVDFSYYQTPKLKLANYDVSFIDHGCDNIVRGIGFTDRQLKTAAKIITKYKRQIAEKLDIAPDYLLDTELPPHRISTRNVDRRYVVGKNATGYTVKFPYDSMMVRNMYTRRNNSCGGYEWNRDARHWSIAPTEHNLALLYEYITKYSTQPWEIDPAVQEDFGVIENARSNIYNHVPYLDFDDNDQLCLYNSNPHLDVALKNFDLNANLARVVFFADNYGLSIGTKLTTRIEEQYNNIHQVLLTPQRKIFDNASRMHTDLAISDLEHFMATVGADHWMVVTFGLESTRRSGLVDAVLEVDVPGKKSYHQYRDGKKKNGHEFLLNESKSQSVVLFVDSTYVLSQLSIELPRSTSLLKVVYLYSHDTGKKIEKM